MIDLVPFLTFCYVLIWMRDPDFAREDGGIWYRDTCLLGPREPQSRVTAVNPGFRHVTCALLHCTDAGWAQSGQSCLAHTETQLHHIISHHHVIKECQIVKANVHVYFLVPCWLFFDIRVRYVVNDATLRWKQLLKKPMPNPSRSNRLSDWYAVQCFVGCPPL